MSRDLMTTWHIYSTDVDGAREEILRILERGSYVKTIYFHGWDGFGASPVLRSIAEMLQCSGTTPELCFDKLIYIDCSEWKNRRAVQRAIAEELDLDCSVMAILDEQDEEDDCNGVDESSRDDIDNVGQVIAQALMDTKLMMIFLNGSDEEIDLSTFGIPHFGRYGNNMMIWTFSRSWLTMDHDLEQAVDKLRYTHNFVYVYKGIRELPGSKFYGLLQQQGAAIVARAACMMDIDLAVVANCCLYELFLRYNFHNATKRKFDWAAHASNYWMSDGIIEGDKARDISNALHREINWECDATLVDNVLKKFMEDSEPPFLVLKDEEIYKEGSYRWISVTSKNIEISGMQTIPAPTSSFFLAFECSDCPPSLPNGFFEHSSKLGVLVLRCCAFNFASPPFLICHSIRFLGLDHCTDDKKCEGKDHIEWTYLCNISVLDLRYTDWNEILSEEKMDIMTNIRELNIEGVRGWQYMSNLQHRLPNLQRLRITKPTCQWIISKDFDNSFIDKTSMEILDLSGNSDMKSLPASLSMASSLGLLVLDGCYGLENVGSLPSSLESFSFNGHGPASQWTQDVELPLKQFRPSTTSEYKDIRISKISLEGCTQLKNLFLCGLPNLLELDLSGTAIKVLDFKTMVVQVPRLKRLFLIGCKHLRAIISVREIDSDIKPDLELVCIDTRVGIVCPQPSINKKKPRQLQVHVVARDARLTRSLKDLLGRCDSWSRRVTNMKYLCYNIHVTSSPMYGGGTQFEADSKNKIGPDDQESLQNLIRAGPYSDVLSIVGDPPMQAFPQPPSTQLDQHVEIAKGSCYVESELKRGLRELVGCAKSLHVHDVDVSIRAVVSNQGYSCGYLKWCRVERCLKLDTVFQAATYDFGRLETFWASDLLMARWIWSRPFNRNYTRYISFENLQHLHLRSCPSLQFVLPVWVSSFPSLKTLHMIHCGDLVHVFMLNIEYPEEITIHGVLFPKLTAIHLHDLPKLQQICEVKMMAPALETIKIRGCWSLRRLPSVGSRGQGEKKLAVEIEKDVWDALKWDAGHCPDHFEAPVHSRYYKEKLPRVSVLRYIIYLHIDLADASCVGVVCDCSGLYGCISVLDECLLDMRSEL
ncbi:uncharacterized protein [Triticum aestivum]|uniref:uncharacterized protein n=1 Tax=Triticum aestivum TaxID=4565 RepID=UPI001D0296D9|nr:uncharacterized protein LOC123064190 [Triticum aestivum]